VISLTFLASVNALRTNISQQVEIMIIKEEKK